MTARDADAVRPYVNIVRPDGTLAPDPYPLPDQRPGQQLHQKTCARAFVLADCDFCGAGPGDCDCGRDPLGWCEVCDDWAYEPCTHNDGLDAPNGAV